MPAKQTSTAVIQTISNNTDLSLFNMINSADFIGKSVMLILIISSIWSWAIIINKLIEYSKIYFYK